MDETDKKALYSSILFGIVIAVFFMPQLGTAPVFGYTTYSSTHTQTYKNIFGGTLYKWWTNQEWTVSAAEIIYEDYTVGHIIYSGLHYWKGIKAHQVTYRSPGGIYWKIATKVEFGSFIWTFPHSMTAKCYNTGGVVWYNSWN